MWCFVAGLHGGAVSRRRVVVAARQGSDVVVVAGATGRTGRLVVEELVRRGTHGAVRAIVRDEEKARQMFGNDGKVELAVADVRQNDERLRSAVKGATTLISCVGSTAVRTAAWEGGKNTPREVVALGVPNLLSNLEAETIEKVILLSAVGTRNSSIGFKIFDAFGGAWSSFLTAEDALIKEAKEKDFAYSIIHLPSLKDVGKPANGKANVRLRRGDLGRPAGQFRREDAAELCVECTERDTGREFTISPFNVPGESVNWDQTFEAVLGCPVVLSLEFASLNKNKFRGWLLDWGASLPTNGALFPPLPLPVRVDPTDDGVRLSFLRVKTGGEVINVGALHIILEDSRLVVRREPVGRDSGLPGEKQVLQVLVQSLDRVTR